MKIVYYNITVSLFACIAYMLLDSVVLTYGEENVTNNISSTNENHDEENNNNEDNTKNIVTGQTISNTDSANPESTNEEGINELLNSLKKTESELETVIKETGENYNINNNGFVIPTNSTETSQNYNINNNGFVIPTNSTETKESQKKNEASVQQYTENEISLNQIINEKSRKILENMSTANEKIKRGLCSFFRKCKNTSDSFIKGKEGLYQKFKDTTEIKFLSSYSGKSLTELMHDVSLIFKEINKHFHMNGVIDLKPHLASLEAIAPHLVEKAEKGWKTYVHTRANINRRLQIWALQDILNESDNRLKQNPTKEDVEALFNKLNSIYFGYFGISLSFVNDKWIGVQFNKFSKSLFIDTALHFLNAEKTCTNVTCGRNSTCYMIDGKPQCLCLSGYIEHLDSNYELVCDKIQPVTCKANNGGCSPHGSCVAHNSDIVCFCKSNFIGDGVLCSNKFTTSDLYEEEEF